MALAGVPLNCTVAVGVNPMPLMSTTVPTGPPVGEYPVIDSVGVNVCVLVAVPAAVVTEITEAVAPLGTVVLICVADRRVKLAARLPNLTLLAPLRYVPVIVTRLPVIPDVGVNELIVGATNGVTVALPLSRTSPATAVSVVA